MTEDLTEEDRQEIFDEGYEYYYSHDPDDGEGEHDNPYTGLMGEIWADGWADAEEDNS